MDRQFVARITTLHYMFIFLMGGMAFYGMIVGEIIYIIVGSLLLLLAVERAIHTVYTVKINGNIEIDRGRFVKKINIASGAIQDVSKSSYLQLFGYRLFCFVRIDFMNNRYIDLYPHNEEAFVKCVESRKFKQIDEEEYYE